MENKFTPQARRIWEQIPLGIKTKILNAVWCGNCTKAITILYYTGTVVQGDLLLEGECDICGNKVARLIENE